MTKGGAADSSVGVWHVLARAGMHGILSIVNHCGDDALRISKSSLSGARHSFSHSHHSQDELF